MMNIKQYLKYYHKSLILKYKRCYKNWLACSQVYMAIHYNTELNLIQTDTAPHKPYTLASKDAILVQECLVRKLTVNKDN